MRHRDDDLEPFRDDPVVTALTGPADPAELAGEADAVAAYQEAVSATVPPPRRRSAARIATGSTVAVLTIGLSGGVAAAYANYLPDSLQKTLHDKIHSIPAPDEKPSKPPTASQPPPVVAPAQPVAPTPSPAHSGLPAQSTPSPAASSLPPSPQPSTSLPAVVPTPSVTASATPTATATPPAPAVPAGRLAISVSPGGPVTVGTSLTVTGKLTASDGSAVEGRRVALVERTPGQPGRHRLGHVRTSAHGEVTFSVASVQRNLRLLLRSGPVRSAVEPVVVVPIIHVEVPPTAAGATSVSASVTVSGAQPGDVVVLRGPTAHDGRRATLDSSLHASFTIPVSQSQALHYRAEVKRTRAHAAHSLPFYVPPSGG